MNSSFKKQSNGIEEQLNSENREKAENYYKLKKVGPSAEERYRHFRTNSKLTGIFYNFQHHLIGEPNEIAQRLPLLEWAAFEWNGEL